jgi:hypothetical protein
MKTLCNSGVTRTKEYLYLNHKTVKYEDGKTLSKGYSSQEVP